MKTIAVAILFAVTFIAPARAQTTTGGTPQDSTPAVQVPIAPTTTSYDPATGFPDHVGGFSGMVVVIPQTELDAFNAPGGARQLDRVAKAEPGAVLAIKLVFVGMKPDYYNQADVTYDLQVTAPDGTIYGGSDYRGVDALHGQLGDQHGVFDNRNKVVLLQFDPQDAPGVYTIRAVLHDRIGQVDLPLQTSVEMVRPASDAPPPVPGAQDAPPPMAKYTVIAPPEMQLPDKTAKPVAKRHGHRRRH